MRYLIGVMVILLSFSLANGQSVNVSPISIPAWGNTLHTSQASFDQSFDRFHARIVGVWINKTNTSPDSDYKSHGGFLGAFVGYELPYKRATLTGYVGAFNRRFTNRDGAYVNFLIEAKYKVTNDISLFYSHISNGWQKDFNVGLDNIGFSISL